MWAKADMIATVSFARLDLPRSGRDHEGKRKYLTICLDLDQQRRVYASVLCALGLPQLTSHLR
jgi:mRNA interferase MazF